MAYEEQCKRCGQCCTGSPKLSSEDIQKILELGIDKLQFIELINNVPYMRMVEDKCVFLGVNSGKHHCRIYDSRPSICKLYPGGEYENCQPERWAFDEYLEKKNRERYETTRKDS